MGNQIYQRKEFKIYKVYNGFIVHNTRKPFKDGHTHLRSFKICKTVINSVINGNIPRRFSPYLLRSLIRVCKDSDVGYVDKVESLIKAKKNNKNPYYNVGGRKAGGNKK